MSKQNQVDTETMFSFVVRQIEQQGVNGALVVDTALHKAFDNKYGKYIDFGTFLRSMVDAGKVTAKKIGKDVCISVRERPDGYKVAMDLLEDSGLPASRSMVAAVHMASTDPNLLPSEVSKILHHAESQARLMQETVREAIAKAKVKLAERDY